MPQVIYADNLTEGYGTEKCRRIRQHIFTELSPIAGDLAAHYVRTAERSSFEQANHALIDIHNQLRIEDYNCAIYHHLIPTFGDLTIAELTASKIKEWLSELPCSNKRKSNVLTPLRQMYEEMYHDEIIDKNPLARAKNLPTQSREPKPFTQEEVTKILNELTGQAKNLIQFAFWSGLRTSELIALRWQDVDFQHNRVFIKSACVRGERKETKTKSGKREVTLQPQAREALLNQQTYTEKLNDTVFHDPRTNNPWKDDQPIRKNVWTPALKRAGIKYRNPYQTRHTFASTLLSRGENPLWVAQQMGHKDWGQIIKIYGQWIPPSK